MICIRCEFTSQFVFQKSNDVVVRAVCPADFAVNHRDLWGSRNFLLGSIDWKQLHLPIPNRLNSYSVFRCLVCLTIQWKISTASGNYDLLPVANKSQVRIRNQPYKLWFTGELIYRNRGKRDPAVDFGAQILVPGSEQTTVGTIGSTDSVHEHGTVRKRTPHAVLRTNDLRKYLGIKLRARTLFNFFSPSLGLAIVLWFYNKSRIPYKFRRFTWRDTR